MSICWRCHTLTRECKKHRDVLQPNPKLTAVWTSGRAICFTKIHLFCYTFLCHSTKSNSSVIFISENRSHILTLICHTRVSYWWETGKTRKYNCGKCKLKTLCTARSHLQLQKGAAQRAWDWDDAQQKVWYNDTWNAFTVFSVEDLQREHLRWSQGTSEISSGVKQMEYTPSYFHGSL